MTRRTETKKLRMVDIGFDKAGKPYAIRLDRPKAPLPMREHVFERDGNIIMVKLSIGQIINEDKAYKRWKKQNGIL